MTPDRLETTYYPVKDLTPYHKNAHKGNVARIRGSLRDHQQFKPVVVNLGTLTGRPLEVLCGSHTLFAAREEGWSELAAVTVDVDDMEAIRINLVDNPRAGHPEDLDYDERLLLELLADLPDLDGTGYDLGDVDVLEKAMREELAPGDTAPDDTPEPPADPVCQLGDLWLLGPHRLLCDDAEDVNAHDSLLEGERPGLLLMDPPYGMRLNTDFSVMKGTKDFAGTHGNRYEPVIGDDEDYDPGPIVGLYQDVAEQFWWGADYYSDRIPDRVEGSWLVWDKRPESQADGFGSEFELCWSRKRHKRRMLRHHWFAFFTAESRNRMHPTQKPVALYSDILQQWGTKGGLVLDTYAGSGTTVIACHQTGMLAAVMELSPAYCDVICRRYQEHTGTVPTREGVPHDFTQAGS